MTGLLSRSDFRCALEVPSLRGCGAVLLADIDQFVFLNAVLDHVVGDQMLQSPLQRQPLEAIDLALAACSQAKAAGGNRIFGIAPGLEGDGKD
jgi:GGDEF domain-containing protein